MSNISEEKEDLGAEIKSTGTVAKQDDVEQRDACAAEPSEVKPSVPEEVPTKKRKTRRGKSKRKQPYIKNGRKSKLIKPEAPHNSNQFLLEDHGIIEELDENLKCSDQVSTSTVTRTRDSSFSVDSDGEFYSSPDDEEQFLRKDFDDQYESLQVERLNAMTKTDLIQEYMHLQGKVDTLTKRLSNIEDNNKKTDENTSEFERLKLENENLKKELDILRSKNMSCSEDSETDSSDSCSSSTSSSSSSCSVSREQSPELHEVDYKQTNGHTSPPQSVEPI
ncbi:unnamed protein product [Brassicogethes aeneus]|uniref:Uncharacterized protein n=1 Tax=Brassicogethes aeneus TaxID=1431903 RepID=A0A9P0AXT6_BRAAE|nr:unnamed protein product [Brassicogethes aeneus]